MENLKQGTRVKFDVQTFKGMGTIVGVYDYTHFVACEFQFKVISEV